MLIWPGASIAPSEPPPSRGLFERNRGRGSVERNRDSRLLIALYSSWSMPASKAISSSSAKLFRFHGPLDAEILSFLRGNFIINRIQLCIRVFVFVFEKFPLDPKRTATARESYDRTIIYRLELIPWRIGLQVESYIMLFACSKTRRGSLGRSRISRGHYREIFLRKKAKRTRKVPFFITIPASLRSNYQSRFHRSYAVNWCTVFINCMAEFLKWKKTRNIRIGDKNDPVISHIPRSNEPDSTRYPRRWKQSREQGAQPLSVPKPLGSEPFARN